jgi:hypothetical protein
MNLQLRVLSVFQMFQIPSIVTMSIAATRIHRSLVNYPTESEVYDMTSSHSSERSLWLMS